MSKIMLIVACQLSSVTCVGVAGALAMTDRPGWLWFLVGAAVFGVSINAKVG